MAVFFANLSSSRQFRLVRSIGRVIEGTAFDVVPDAAGRPAGAAAIEVVEAAVLGQQREIGGRALEVIVVHFYEQHIGGCSHQPHHDFRDDAALTEAPEHGVEKIAIALVGAGCDLAVAGHDLELLHMVDLKTKVVGGYAKSAGTDRSPDRKERVGDHRHRQFLDVRGHEDGVPLRTGADFSGPASARFVDADGIQAAGIDDYSALGLGLAEKRMPLAAHRDLESLAVGELHELRDVLRIAGPEHGDRLLVHDVSEVVGRRLQHGIIEVQLTLEIPQVVAQRLRCGQVIPRWLQRKQCRTTGEPFAQVAARDVRLHDLTSPNDFLRAVEAEAAGSSAATP